MKIERTLIHFLSDDFTASCCPRILKPLNTFTTTVTERKSNQLLSLSVK